MNSDAVLGRFAEPAGDTARRRLASQIASAKAAYISAFRAIHKSAKTDGIKAILESSTEKDLRETAMDIHNAQAAGFDKSRINRFVDALQHYHGVFDVLSQGGGLPFPTLIWGGMKLILIMLKNRSDLLMKVTDMLADIGLTLSRIETFTILFPTTRMIELTLMLYSAVVEFLEGIITQFQNNAIRRVFSSLMRPFEERYGHVMTRIQSLADCIHKDANANAIFVQVMQSRSLARHGIDAAVHRDYVEAALGLGIPDGQVPRLFQQIKNELFRGFEVQASYHEDLAAIFGVTSGSWEEWFRVEQQCMPTDISRETRFIQAISDAADPQHALQWAAYQRARSPQLPSAYLIWSRGMTAQAAISSLIFQILQQKPQVISKHNLDMKMFARANVSIKALWALFIHLMRILGGCLIYVCMGSAGPDEFALVEIFVKTMRDWDGPPISVLLTHPWNAGFVCSDHAVDSDGLFQVHPSLFATDPLYHILLLELDVHASVSEAIQTVLWESAWREIRYSVIHIVMDQTVDIVRDASNELGSDLVKAEKLAESDFDLWVIGVSKWINNKASMNVLREQLQRHLDIIDLELPADIRASLVRRLKCLVLTVDMNQIDARPLTQAQRDRIWGRIRNGVLPSIVAMFCGSVKELVDDALDEYSQLLPKTERQACLAALQLFGKRFGWDGIWKRTFSSNNQRLVSVVVEGIQIGLEHTIAVLTEPETDSEE